MPGVSNPPNDESYGPQSTGISGVVRLIYVPEGQPIVVRGLDPHTAYAATYFDPVSGTKTSLSTVRPDAAGLWTLSAARRREARLGSDTGNQESRRPTHPNRSGVIWKVPMPISAIVDLVVHAVLCVSHRRFVRSGRQRHDASAQADRHRQYVRTITVCAFLLGCGQPVLSRLVFGRRIPPCFRNKSTSVRSRFQWQWRWLRRQPSCCETLT